MWTKGNYRRNLMDMHIDDWNEEFLSRINVQEYVDALEDAGVQCAMVKAKSHTGLCYWPAEIGRMHRGLKGYDFFGEMVKACHEKGIAVIAYYSQIFDNWAYDQHPDWRLVAPDGKNFREYRGLGWFRSGRYGICCPNNEDYRAYVRANLQELNRKYDFEGMFLDMTFWTEVCYCPSCRKRYLAETGREIPRVVDWQDPAWRDFAQRREEWLAEFARFSTESVKAVKPQVTVEHQFSMIATSWVNGSTELLTEASDYSGGDYYGGYLQQSFINKYYRSVSASLPFVYHTGRCDPELAFHTTTKTEEQLILHAITALVHDGAFLLVDALNPDGTIVPEVYHDLMKRVYGFTRPYEPYVGGKLKTDAAIWFPSRAKHNPELNGIDVREKSMDPDIFIEAPVAMTSILRENNVPFHVIGSKNLREYDGQLLILSNVASIREEEMDALEAFVARGGSLYVSGPIAHPRLEKLLGVRVTGRTDHDFTYMDPTPAGGELKGFSALAPLTVPRFQYLGEILPEAEGVETLATLTLPWTMTGTDQFSAIHSNPPGIHTHRPAITRRRLGESQLMWTAAPLELSQPYMSRQAVKNLVCGLMGEPVFRSNAPKFVEILCWEKEGKTYLAALNEQEESPVVPLGDIWVQVPGKVRAWLLPEGTSLQTETEKAWTKIYLPKLHLAQVIEVENCEAE
ncbi:MAG: alpha-L-fucosidase [Clostridia bacterium]|nr:alpha-L-fucosidase [Clostridia bacterium]